MEPTSTFFFVSLIFLLMIISVPVKNSKYIKVSVQQRIKKAVKDRSVEQYEEELGFWFPSDTDGSLKPG